MVFPNVGIREINCEYRVVIADRRPQKQRPTTGNTKRPGGKKARALVKKPVAAGLPRDRISSAVKHRKGVTLFEDARTVVQ